MEYISQLIRYSRACGSYHDFLHRGLLLTRKVLNQGFLVVNLKSSHRNLTVAIMTYLAVTDYMCHKISRICSVHRNHNPILSSFITRFETRATERMPLLEHAKESSVFLSCSVAHSLVFCVVFCRSLLSLRPFSFGHCIVCPSVISGFFITLLVSSIFHVPRS